MSKMTDETSGIIFMTKEPMDQTISGAGAIIIYFYDERLGCHGIFLNRKFCLIENFVCFFLITKMSEIQGNFIN